MFQNKRKSITEFGKNVDLEISLNRFKLNVTEFIENLTLASNGGAGSWCTGVEQYIKPTD